MRRWLVLFFLAILPMQLSWAAMASYCRHETVPAKSAHFGHHEHDHDASGADAGHVVDTLSPLALDDDCSYCHLGCAQALVDSATGTAGPLPPPRVALLNALHDSHIPQGPERPDRRVA